MSWITGSYPSGTEMHIRGRTRRKEGADRKRCLTFMCEQTLRVKETVRHVRRGESGRQAAGFIRSKSPNRASN